MKPYIYPYLLGSHGARELSSKLGTIQVRANGKYVPKPGHLIINWGNSQLPTWWGETAFKLTINRPQSVANAIDKVRAFTLFSANQVPTLDWTTDITVAKSWFNEPGNRVVCRTLSRASEGRGIVIAEKIEELVPAPLYTKYRRKVHEYRVHVGFGRVFDRQMKRRRNGLPKAEGSGRFVRNTANGWVFCRNNITVPAAADEAGIKAVYALGLDFGAVDIGVNDQGVSVYEVNTAPGLEGQTSENYVNFFKGIL